MKDSGRGRNIKKYQIKFFDRFPTYVLTKISYVRQKTKKFMITNTRKFMKQSLKITKVWYKKFIKNRLKTRK